MWTPRDGYGLWTPRVVDTALGHGHSIGSWTQHWVTALGHGHSIGSQHWVMGTAGPGQSGMLPEICCKVLPSHKQSHYT